MSVVELNAGAAPGPVARVVALLTAPAVAVFLSSNLVNAGNLAFNMVFSRVMGPALYADLACILTIKLAVLNVLGAMQMAVSRQVAEVPSGRLAAMIGAISAAARRSLVVGAILGPLVALFLWAQGSSVLHMTSGLSLPLLALAIPFAVPLSLMRGIAAGRLDVAAMTWTAQVEMTVRLFGSLLAWWAGLGIEGVVFAIVLSIFAAWIVVARPATGVTRWVADGWSLSGLAAVAAPLAGLQLAQVILLDGDVLLAKALMPAEAAGFAAALGLIQRIQVFACVGVGMVLVPQVAAAVADGRPVLPAILPAAKLVGLATAAMAIAAIVAPEIIVSVLSGPDFRAAAPMVLPTVLSAGAFTVAYLGATCLVAIGARSGLWLMLAAVVVQSGAIAAMAGNFSGAELGHIVTIKLVCQATLCVSILGACAARLRPARQTLTA